MANYFDRYNKFRANGGMKTIPGIIIPQNSADKFAIYQQGKSRLDKISDLYYGNPYGGWLILLANPQFGGLEFNIPNQTLIRIPFPYETAIQSYITQVNNFNLLYGI